MFGLTSQLRWSAVSLAGNIAEGQGRLSRGEFRQFLGQAMGSLIEMEAQVVIAGNLGLADVQNNCRVDGRLRRGKPPSPRANRVASTGRAHGKNQKPETRNLKLETGPKC